MLVKSVLHTVCWSVQYYTLYGGQFTTTHCMVVMSLLIDGGDSGAMVAMPTPHSYRKMLARKDQDTPVEQSATLLEQSITVISFKDCK